MQTVTENTIKIYKYLAAAIRQSTTNAELNGVLESIRFTFKDQKDHNELPAIMELGRKRREEINVKA